MPGKTLAQIYCKGLENRVKECNRLIEEIQRELEKARRHIEEAEARMVKLLLLRLEIEEGE